MVATYNAARHDIGILRQDGSTTAGFMLDRDKNNVPRYAYFAEKKLADQFFTGLPDYGYQDPEKEVPIWQDDWRAGLGLEVQDVNDAKRYHKSTMDMRFRNKGLAGWISTQATLPTIPTPTLVNGDMELTTGWTNGGRSAAQAHGGTYSWSLAADETYQDIAWDADYKGAYVTITAWIYGVTDATGRIGLDDGLTATYCATTSTYDAWTQITVSKKFSASATRFRLLLDFVSLNNNYYVDDVVITVYPIMGVATTRCEFNSSLYINAGNVLLKLNAGGTGFDVVGSLPATITSFAVMTISTTSYLFIAIGTSNAYWYMTTAEAFTESTAAVKTFKYFVLVHTTADTMYGSDSDNTLRSTVNPLNGGTAWSGQTIVGETFQAITKLLEKQGACYIMKKNIPYYLDSTGAVKTDLAPELASLAESADNGKNAIVWLDKLYLPWGAQALLEVGSANTWRGPANSSTGASEYDGQVFSVAGDDSYLYATADNSTKVENLCGRLETIDGETAWVWHCINETTLTGCETSFVSSIYQKRYWFTSTTASEGIYYIPLPVGYANVTSDANRAFLTGTTMETSWLHGNFKFTTKAFPPLTLVMGHTYDADIYFTVKYKKLEDTSWTTIGNYTGSATSMTETKYLPADASSNNPKSTMLKLQFTAVTDDTTKTPILLGYILQGVLYPGQRNIIACSIKCANEVTDREGLPIADYYDGIVAVIDEAMAATYPVTIYDIFGSTQTVKFLPVNPLWTVTREEKGRVIESAYNLLMQKVSLS